MSGLMSAKTTSAPSAVAPLAVATKVSGVVTTSSPGPMPRAAYAVCSAAVPEVTLTAPGVPARAASRLESVTHGPVVSQSLRSTSTTAATSLCRSTGGRRGARSVEGLEELGSRPVNHSSLVSDR